MAVSMAVTALGLHIQEDKGYVYRCHVSANMTRCTNTQVNH